MVDEVDQKDRNESRKIAVALISLIVILLAGAVLMLPALSDIVAIHLSPGLGLKDAAVLSFFITVAIMIVFAVVSGDGLLGEIQFMLGAFFLFFIILWLLTAWIF